MKGRVLIIAGSDPSGGAGIQADIKTVTALGGYASTAITALTVQNTKGVTAVLQTPPDFIRDQIDAVLSDIGADAIKIGMIGDVAAAQSILDALQSMKADSSDGTQTPMVLDPVLVATSGDALAASGVATFIRERLIPICEVVTPNLDEAEALTSVSISSPDDQSRAGEKLLKLGAKAALISGGHIAGDTITDVLATKEGTRLFSNPKIETTSTHGTGCTLASAIAVGLAQALPLERAVERAIAYVRKAIETAPSFGAGAGPVNHTHPLDAD
ncbi:MAG: bifunctional hydroxymethylpyrimidine kinase/phosphomethylpyrimidine kinase [Pseudomonadota bacterium]